MRCVMNKTPPDDISMVAVTIIMPWKGKCPDDAANQAAMVIGHVVQETAEFYGQSCMTWGPVEDVENPA